ncbi:phospholipase-like protein [Tanacetum coccineum]
MHIVDYLLHLARFMMLREDFCLITGFRFDKVSLHPKEEDHSEFRKRVFPKNANLKGEHLLELVKNNVEFHQLDDKDVVRVCLLLALDYVFMGQEIRHKVYNVAVDRRKYHLEKLASNPKYEANYVLYGFVFPLKLFMVTMDYTYNRYEVWRLSLTQSIGGVKMRMFVDKEEVLHRVVDEEDVQERVVLEKTVKEQEQMIADMQRRLYSVEKITKKLNTGPSDVDLLDKNGNHSNNVPVGGLDHQSMEGVSKCMNNDQVDKDFVMDDPEFKATDNEEGSYSDTFLSTQQVREIMNDFFDTLPIGPNSVQDVGVSESMVVDQPSLDTVKTGVVPLQRQKYLGKACKKRRLVMKLDKSNIVIKTLIGPDGNEIPLLPWKEWTFPWLQDGHVIRIDFWEKLVGRSHTKRGWLSDDPNDDWAMASPYLSDMLLRYEYPLYYADGVKYDVPWFAKSVKKVYFPVNENDSHWVLGELDITSGVITFYDSLGGPPGGVETHHFLLELRQKLGVPLQGGLYGDCGLWVCIFLYRLSHNIPLEVDDSSTVALAWRERIFDFYWRYKILQDGNIVLLTIIVDLYWLFDL